MPLILLLVFLLLVVIFTVQNSLPVTLNFFVWHLGASLAVVVVACFVLGMIIAGLVLMPRMIRRRAQIKKLQGQVASLQEVQAKEIHDEASAPKLLK